MSSFPFLAILLAAATSAQTGASLLHVTAHPDDEHGGMLTLLSRGQGVRVVLLSLTRGEAGANAIGPELFDGLGWIRAEELAAAGRFYGLDALYFTRLADYGYSKRLSEAEEKWGKEEALRDVVSIIRRERPLVVVSRFQGNERDGHGQHQFAGVIAREAFRAAGDGARFPEAGNPWEPLKLYMGGMREDEDWNVVVDSGVYDPRLGDSYENVARQGLALQRSQTAGRIRPVEGSFRRYYRRVESLVETKE
jgi:LmbE family N-acetylglucosaminyl deacetylase